jgi:hypothetical protein
VKQRKCRDISKPEINSKISREREKAGVGGAWNVESWSLEFAALGSQ